MISNGIPYQKFTDLQTAAFSLAHFSKILRYCPLRSCLLQKQELTGSLQNNCSKQQLKLADRPASVLEKDVLVDFLLYNKPRKAKSKTSKGKMKSFQWQCRRRCMLVLIFWNGPRKQQLRYENSDTGRKLSLRIFPNF